MNFIQKSSLAVLLALAISLLTAGCGSQESSTPPPAAETSQTGTPQSGINWITDFQAASKAAAEDNRHMLLNFTGSDWCPWCFKIRDEIFATPEFIAYADSDLVCVYLDFPNKKPIPDALKKQNAALAKQFEVKGFPTILVLSPKGEVVGKTGYKPGGGAKYVEHLKEIIDGGE